MSSQAAGARWIRAALQVNPYDYKGVNAPSGSFASEADYNTALLDRCASLGIEVIAITDVGWATGAVPGLLLTRFPWPPAEPDMRLSPHPALHVSRSSFYPVAGWMLVQGVGIRVPR
jgi:hypothetical protein